MKRVLTGRVRVRHLLLIAVGIGALGSSAAAFAGSGPSSPQVLVASASADFGDNDLTTPANGTEVKVLSLSFDIPQGKKGDLEATFSGVIQHNNGQQAICLGGFRLTTPSGPLLLDPPFFLLIGGATDSIPDLTTTAFSQFTKNLQPGHYVLKAMLWSQFATWTVSARGMNIVVLLH